MHDARADGRTNPRQPAIVAGYRMDVQEQEESAPMFHEALESRRLHSVSAYVDVYGTLNVRGDAGNNGIAVGLSSDNRTLLVQEYTGPGHTYTTRMTFAASAVRSIAMYGLAGSDTLGVDRRITLTTAIFGGDGNDYIYGGAGTDVLNGENGNDILIGNEGNDYLFGGNNDDTLWADYGQDYMSGGAGIDTVTYEGRIDDLILRANGRWESGGRNLKGRSWENDCINWDVENLTGGSGSDWIYANGIRAGTVHGGFGRDYIVGSNLADNLYGDGGDDDITGNGGRDLIVGGEGSDYIYARDGEMDLIFGGNTDGSGTSGIDRVQTESSPASFDVMHDIDGYLF
jgi:Ca2+-binding RTX toxin-like protein